LGVLSSEIKKLIMGIGMVKESLTFTVADSEVVGSTIEDFT
jgi:hypothetical protein